MVKSDKPLSVSLGYDEVYVNHDLKIVFQRTVRVPGNGQVSNLPPGLDRFDLEPVARYADKFPPGMVAKGGLFLPMYQSEAMWISFECRKIQAYMIKVYVGGVNVISGEPAVEDEGTKLRRLTKLAKKATKGVPSRASPLQDYIVVPDQPWLDGIAGSNGTVRQFVAMPFGSGHSVESQITGKDAAGGIQFEITPYTLFPRLRPVRSPFLPGEFPMNVRILPDIDVPVCVSSSFKVSRVKEKVEEQTGIPPSQQRLIWKGRQMADDRTLSELSVTQDGLIHLVFALRGGGAYDPYQMSIAAGGQIHQTIKADRYGEKWLPASTTVFNVQILNSAVYKHVTGKEPPTKPISATLYKKYGLPFYKMYEEPSGISGDFDMVTSVAQTNETTEEVVEPRAVTIDPGSIDLTNPNGPLLDFRTVRDLTKQLSGFHIADFK